MIQRQCHLPGDLRKACEFSIRNVIVIWKVAVYVTNYIPGVVNVQKFPSSYHACGKRKAQLLRAKSQRPGVHSASNPKLIVLAESTFANNKVIVENMKITQTWVALSLGKCIIRQLNDEKVFRLETFPTCSALFRVFPPQSCARSREHDKNFGTPREKLKRCVLSVKGFSNAQNKRTTRREENRIE